MAGTTEAEPVALVTGGSSGIGRATALALLDAGYRVLICARGQEGLDAVVREVGDDRLAAHACDAGDPAQARAVVEATVARFGRLDAVICAHGVIGSFQPIEELDAAGWDDVLRTNLMGQINITTAAIGALRATRGSVVLIASVNAHQAEPVMAPYGVSKVYGVNGHRPDFTMTRMRPNVVWSPTSGAPPPNEPSSATRSIAVSGCFVAIGHAPGGPRAVDYDAA